MKEIENDEKLIRAITKVANCMIELSNLVSKHEIEGSLFHYSNTVKIFKIIGRKRQTDIMTKVIESHHDEKKVWQEIMKYLEKEIQIKEKILLYEEIKLKNPEIPRPQKGGRNNAYNVDHLKSKKCFFVKK